MSQTAEQRLECHRVNGLIESWRADYHALGPVFTVRLPNTQVVAFSMANIDAFLMGLESAHQAWREAIRDYPGKEPSTVRQWRIVKAVKIGEEDPS